MGSGFFKVLCANPAQPSERIMAYLLSAVFDKV